MSNLIWGSRFNASRSLVTSVPPSVSTRPHCSCYYSRIQSRQHTHLSLSAPLPACLSLTFLSWLICCLAPTETFQPSSMLLSPSSSLLLKKSSCIPAVLILYLYVWVCRCSVNMINFKSFDFFPIECRTIPSNIRSFLTPLSVAAYIYLFTIYTFSVWNILRFFSHLSFNTHYTAVSFPGSGV